MKYTFITFMTIVIVIGYALIYKWFFTSMQITNYTLGLILVILIRKDVEELANRLWRR